MSEYTARTELQSTISLSTSTPKVQTPRSSHRESHAASLADTIGCLHACRASLSSKK